MRSRAYWVVTIAILSACTRVAPERQLISDAAEALGGRERILSASTLVMEGAGTQRNLGQDVLPSATEQTLTLADYKQVIDLPGGRTRIEQTSTANFPFFLGQGSLKQVMGFDGAVGYIVYPNGNARRMAAAAEINRLRAVTYQHPLMSLRLALDPAATLTNLRSEGGQQLVDVRSSGGFNFTVAVDRATKLPTRFFILNDNTNLGDVIVETTFADYGNVNGLKLPRLLTNKTDTVTTMELRIVKQAIDGDAGDFSVPEAVMRAEPIAAPGPAVVTAEEVGKGVWLLGQGHRSVLVEFADHLMLIEAPANDERTLAVIAKARELRPDKPLTQVVNTHHHFDHSGGIRAAVSEGLTVIAHKNSASFFEDVVKRPHTIAPDALAKNPKPLKMQTVDGEMVLRDNTMTVNLYAIEGNPHADTMLVAYFPKERMLVEVDMYTPYTPGLSARWEEPFAPNLLENLQRRNLKIERIVPLHGQIASVPYAEFVKTAQRNSAHLY